MTQIKLRTSDQHLIAAQKVKIAKGDINSVLLHVEFDSHWGEFTERKALFRNDAVNGNEAQDILMIGDECIVPPEVLSKSGTLEISVTGYTPDGKTKKTSTIVNLKVLESLKDASTTVAPSMDLYMQYLAAIQAEINPVATKINSAVNENMAARLAEFEALFATMQNRFNQIQVFWVDGITLWENENPDEDFGAQTISLNLTNYERVKVIYKDSTFRGFYCEAECAERELPYAMFYHSYDWVGERSFTVADDGVRFSDCIGGSMSNAFTRNDGAIPVRIIGYHYGDGWNANTPKES